MLSGQSWAGMKEKATDLVSAGTITRHTHHTHTHTHTTHTHTHNTHTTLRQSHHTHTHTPHTHTQYTHHTGTLTPHTHTHTYHTLTTHTHTHAHTPNTTHTCSHTTHLLHTHTSVVYVVEGLSFEPAQKTCFLSRVSEGTSNDSFLIQTLHCGPVRGPEVICRCKYS